MVTYNLASDPETIDLQLNTTDDGAYVLNGTYDEENEKSSPDIWKKKKKTLNPYGATKLRITEFYKGIGTEI